MLHRLKNIIKKYSHLAYKLRNVFGAKTFFASDTYLLRYIFKYLPIKVSHQILISKMMVEEATHRLDNIVGNKAKGRISKRVFQERR